MKSEPLDIPDDGLYSISQAARLLEINRSTVYAAMCRGSRNGGLDGRPRRDNGRIQFTGRELKRFQRG